MVPPPPKKKVLVEPWIWKASTLAISKKKQSATYRLFQTQLIANMDIFNCLGKGTRHKAINTLQIFS